MRLRPYAWMPWPLRWAARVLTVILALALVLAGVLVYTVRRSFPQYGGGRFFRKIPQKSAEKPPPGPRAAAFFGLDML